MRNIMRRRYLKRGRSESEVLDKVGGMGASSQLGWAKLACEVGLQRPGFRGQQRHSVAGGRVQAIDVANEWIFHFLQRKYTCQATWSFRMFQLVHFNTGRVTSESTSALRMEAVGSRIIGKSFADSTVLSPYASLDGSQWRRVHQSIGAILCISGGASRGWFRHGSGATMLLHLLILPQRGDISFGHLSTSTYIRVSVDDHIIRMPDRQ